MLSMLENLYHGNIGFDSRRYKPDSPFMKAVRRKNDNMEKLTDSLNDEQKEWFEQYCDAQGDIDSITRYNTYAEALQFGVLLMAEIFIDYCEKQPRKEVIV